jgi:hypothetical protein
MIARIAGGRLKSHGISTGRSGSCRLLMHATGGTCAFESELIRPADALGNGMNPIPPSGTEV